MARHRCGAVCALAAEGGLQERIPDQADLKVSPSVQLAAPCVQLLSVRSNVYLIRFDSRPTRFMPLEEPLLAWIDKFTAKSGRIPNDEEIRHQAFSLAEELGWSSIKFRASSGWLDAFRERHNLRQARSNPGSARTSPTRNKNSPDDQDTPSFGEDGLVDWKESGQASDEDNESAFVEKGMYDDGDDAFVPAGVLGQPRGWERSISGRSSSSSSSFGARREGAAALPVVIEDEAQSVRSRTHTRAQMSRLNSDSSSGPLSGSTFNSPASSISGLQTPDLSIEQDPSQQITPTNHHRVGLRSSQRAQPMVTSTSLPTPVTPADASSRDGYSYPPALPTAFEARGAYHSTPGTPNGSVHTSVDAYGQIDQYLVDSTLHDDAQPGLVEPMLTGWGQDGSSSYGAYGDAIHDNEGLVYAPVEHMLPMDYSTMASGEYGLFQSPAPDATMDPNALEYQPTDTSHLPYQQPARATRALRSQDTSLAARSVSASSTSTSGSSTSFPVSPHHAESPWGASPSMPDYTSPTGTDFFLTGPSSQKHASSATLLPAFSHQSESGARTRSYSSSSLSAAFPSAEQNQAMQTRKRAHAQSTQKKISDEEGKVAIEMARRYLAQNEDDGPDALEEALGRVSPAN